MNYIINVSGLFNPCIEIILATTEYLGIRKRVHAIWSKNLNSNLSQNTIGTILNPCIKTVIRRRKTKGVGVGKRGGWQPSLVLENRYTE